MSMDSSPTILSKEIFEKKYLKKMLILPFEKILQPLKNPLFAELFFQFEPTVAWGGLAINESNDCVRCFFFIL